MTFYRQCDILYKIHKEILMSFFGTSSGGGSLAYKTTVRAASTANVPLSGATPLQVDNVTLVDKDRVLLKNQVLGQNNGIYVVAISGGSYTLSRATDANNQPEIIPNMLIPVSEGQTNRDKVFQLSTDAPIVLGTTVLTFVLGATTVHSDLSGLSNDDHLQYHTDGRALTWLGTRSTSDLPEGLRLYYTQARFDSAFAAKSTSNLTEGTNLYFTTQRARDAVLPVKLDSEVSNVLPVVNGGTNRSSFTEGRIVFAGTSGSSLSEDADLNFIVASKRLGIGTSSPNAKVQINNSGTQLGLSVYSTSTNNTAELYNQGTTNYTLALNSAANSSTTGASIGGYFARGTLSSRAQTLSQDSLLSLSASGHTGSAVAGISAAVVLATDENTTASAYGGQIVFATTPNSTPAGVPLPRVYIKNDGKVLIAGLTASELVATDSSKNLQSLSVSTYPSLTELSYVKGVSSAIQTQLNGKEPTITAGTASQYYRGDKTFQTLNGAAVANTPAGNIAAVTVQAAINELDSEKEPNITAGTTAQYYRGDKTFQTLDKAAVGLGNVDNTSDLNKPISTATQSALDLKADLVGGKVPSSQLPAIAITETNVVNSQSQMLGLTAQTGDVAVRTDLSKSFILAAEPASTLANWQELLTPADAVTSVNGYTGVVILSKSDVGLSNVDNTSDLNKPISTATQSALDGKEPANANIQAHISSTSNPHGVTKTQVGLSNVQNVDQTNASNISSGTLGESYLPSNINAAKIADGSVSSTEFQYLSNVTSDIQSQLNAKEPTVTKGDLTSSDISVTGGTGAVIGSGVSLSITKGNLSEATSSVLTISNGTSAVFGSGTSIEVKRSDVSTSGYLHKDDFAVFNNKQAALSFGDVTSSDITVTGGTGAVIGSGVSLALTKGNISEITSNILTISGGSNAALGSGVTIQVKAASASQDGYLSSTKFSEFDNKQPAGNYITALTGEVTASGPGSAAATIANNAVTNAKLAQVATATFKGRTTSGTGNVEDLTTAQATALLDVMGANSGSGAIKGLVPASAAGDQAKFLRADATWVTVDLSIIPSVHAQTGTVTVSSSAYYVGVDSSGGAVTVNLPAAVQGKKIVVKDEGGQCSQALKSISIVPASGTIDGAANYSMIVNYEALTLVSNGTNWFII